MKAVVNAEDLAEAVKSSSYQPSGTMPILSFLLMSFDESHLTVQATDMQCFSSFNLSCAHKEKGFSGHMQFCVDARKMGSVLNGVTGNVEINRTDEKSINIKAEKSSYTFTTLPASDFPALNTFESKVELDVTANDVAKWLRLAYPINKTYKPACLSGLSIRDGIVSSAGERSVVVIQESGSGVGAPEIILPFDSLSKIASFIDKTCKFSIATDSDGSARRFDITGDHHSLHVYPIADRFPDSLKIINQQARSATWSMTVDRDELLAATKRMVSYVIADAKAGMPIFEFEQEGDKVSLRHFRDETCFEVLTAKGFEGKFRPAAINVQLLSKTVGQFEEDLTIQHTEDAFLITSESAPDETHMLARYKT